MKKWKMYLGCLVAFLLLFTAFYFTIGQFIFFFIYSDILDDRIIAKMKKPEVYRPVAERLALYGQSDPALFTGVLCFAWLPEKLNDIDRYDRMQSIQDLAPNYARVRMSGGFHHFGYILELDEEKSTATTNA